MLCGYCSTPNPETNRFCGECGQPLVRQQVTVPAEFGSTPAQSRREEATISGPSFLGLTDSADDQTDYLLDEEPHHLGHMGWVVFSLIAIVLLAGVGWLEWNAIKTGQIELPWVTAATGSAPAPAQPAENVSATPGASESTANPTDQKPQAENANNDAASTSTTKPSDSEAMLAAADAPKQSDTTSADAKSDAQATRDAQARIATDAANRREEADAGSDANNPNDNSAEEKPSTSEPKTNPVKATEPKPDPRQDRMVAAGEKYLYGRGVPQDCNQALIYFRAAAEKDNAPAMSHLGAMYASGHCVTQNKVAAYKWFSRASSSEPNNQWISRSLNMIWRDMSPQERASVGR